MRESQKNQRPLSLTELVADAFDRDQLKRICEMPEAEFAAAYDMQVVKIPERDRVGDPDFYAFKDNGSDILAVAHLDTVGLADERRCQFIDTEGGTVVFSRALDDRLGAYIILELLPALGLEFDILLTVGEEMGQSTASFFEAEKQYNWMIEFDRGGSDVVLYEYEDFETRQLVRDCGAWVEQGIFSDISYMEHVGIKGFNWGVGYQDYHGPRAHAFLNDTFKMVAYFLRFHSVNAETYLPHVQRPYRPWWERQEMEELENEELDILGDDKDEDSVAHWTPDTLGTPRTNWASGD